LAVKAREVTAATLRRTPLIITVPAVMEHSSVVPGESAVQEHPEIT